MKVIIAGSRKINDYELVKRVIKRSGFLIKRVVCGCAEGVDRLGEKWAMENNIPVIYFPADWVLYGKRAGFHRNFNMASFADALIAVWDGESTGTKNMIDLAKKGKLKIYYHKVNERSKL